MTKAESLSEDELVFHRTLLAQLQGVQGAWQLWSAHLAAKYALTPTDAISAEGAIIRAVTPTDEQQRMARDGRTVRKSG